MRTQTASFSWHRIAMLYQFNAPWLRKQAALYFLFSLAVSIALILIPSHSLRTAIYNPCSTVMFFMFIWAPIVFTKGGDTRIVDRLLPATPIEKFIFYMSYLLIVITFVCYLCPCIADWVVARIYPYNDSDFWVQDRMKSMPDIYICSYYLAPVAAMLTCFYYVVAAKHNRILKAYLMPVVVSIVWSAFNTFYGVKAAVLLGIEGVTKPTDVSNKLEIAEKMSAAMHDHLHFLILCLVVTIGYILALIWFSYRALYRKNM